jgi:hypothetical protein
MTLTSKGARNFQTWHPALVGTSTSAGVGLPPDLSLPIFVYGNLKPGELGHRLIESSVLRQERSEVPGAIRVIDGVPVLTLHDSGSRPGWVLEFADSQSQLAYEIVGTAEPASHYRWTTIPLEGARIVNVLVANDEITSKFDRGGRGYLVDRPEWSTADDPLFAFALSTIADAGRTHAREQFAHEPQPSDWLRLFSLQQALMLLFSILERTAFWTQHGRGVTSAVTHLGKEPEFVEAVREVDLANWGWAIWKTDAPGTRVRLNQPQHFGEWAYQVRSNLMHRGKSSGVEAELVRTTLLDLHDVLRVYLLARVPALQEAWHNIEPASERFGWRLKVELYK